MKKITFIGILLISLMASSAFSAEYFQCEFLDSNSSEIDGVPHEFGFNIYQRTSETYSQRGAAELQDSSDFSSKGRVEYNIHEGRRFVTFRSIQDMETRENIPREKYKLSINGYEDSQVMTGSFYFRDLDKSFKLVCTESKKH